MTYAMVRVRPARLSLDDVRPGRPACIPTWSAGWSPWACSTPLGTPPAAVVLARPARRRSAGCSGCAPGFALNYAAIGARHRSARPDRRPRGALRQRPTAREADHGPEPADPEVAGSAARRADQGAALRAHRGRRRAPAARAARPARRARPARCSRQAGADPAGCARSWRPSSAAARGSAGPGAAPGPGRRHPAAVPPAGRRRAGGQPAQGRVRLRRAPDPGHARAEGRDHRPAACCPGGADQGRRSWRR